MMRSIARWSLLDALQDAHFRRLWLAGLCVNVGRWLDFLVLGWLALDLTGSPFMVGVVAATRSRKAKVAALIDEAAKDDRSAILLDPNGWMTFIRETGLPPDASDQMRLTR